MSHDRSHTPAPALPSTAQFVQAEKQTLVLLRSFPTLLPTIKSMAASNIPLKFGTMQTSGKPVPYFLRNPPVEIPGTVPPTPSWVRGDPAKEKKASRRAAGARNLKLVKEANSKGTRYDFVLYGDSITQFIADDYMDLWKKHFGDLKAAPLGVGGNTVEELSWRLVRGGEKFDKGPKVVGVLIGINNLKSEHDDPTPRLDEFLIPWLRNTWPGSKIILFDMLPNKDVDVRPYNLKYRQMAMKHGSAVSSISCGAGLDPNNPKHLKDGTHPAKDGYETIFRCMRVAVDAMLETYNFMSGKPDWPRGAS